MNNIIVVGNLGQDVEEKTYDNGAKKFWIFSVATNENWKDKTSGEKKSITTWHKCQLFGNYDGLAPYLKQGTTVAVRGLQRNDAIEMRRDGNPVEIDGKKIMQKVPYIKVESINLVGSKQTDQPAQPAAKAEAAKTAEEETDDLPF